MVDLVDVDDDIQYLRTDDQIYFQCTKFSHHDQGKFVLSAEGFGQRKCHLEPISDENGQMPDMSICAFILKQALSLRALHESLARNDNKNKNGSSSKMGGENNSDKNSKENNSDKNKDMNKKDHSSGNNNDNNKDDDDSKEDDNLDESLNSKNLGRNRTLLYGHAVRLCHAQSQRMLCSMATSSSTTDKLAFDVGLTDDENHESGWWTIHPASKQRSEGEKVRIGDDLILVNVASERYLHMSIDMTGQRRVQASFQQTLWMVGPICTERKPGYLCGGDIIRLFHGHTSDDCLTIPKISQSPSGGIKQTAITSLIPKERQRVQYEGAGTGQESRSLWRIELKRVKWSNGHVSWGQPFHLRHITSGHFLGMGENRAIILIEPDSIEVHRAIFCFRQSKDKVPTWDPRQEHDNMGPPEIKIGDNLCFIQHIDTGFWLTYQAVDTRAAKLGHSERPAELHSEGHMDDGFSPSKGQTDEARTAVVIRRTGEIFHSFIRALENLYPRIRSLPDRQTIRRGVAMEHILRDGNKRFGSSIQNKSRDPNNDEEAGLARGLIPRESITHQYNNPSENNQMSPAQRRRQHIVEDTESFQQSFDSHMDSEYNINYDNGQFDDDNTAIPIAGDIAMPGGGMGGVASNSAGYPAIMGGAGANNIPTAGSIQDQPYPDYYNNSNSMNNMIPQQPLPPSVCRISLTEFHQCIEDLIEYFKPAFVISDSADDFEREVDTFGEGYQQHNRRLHNRQTLFQESGMIALALKSVDVLSAFGSAAAQIGNQAIRQMGSAAVALADNWQTMLESLYKLLAAFIKGNRDNCSKFVQHLDWLVLQLDTSKSASIGILMVLIALLEDSPDVLNKVKEKHIKSIISLLEKHGRTPQVLDLLCSLCMCRGVAVRSNQNVICDHLLSGRDLLLQTQLCNQVVSVRPNVFVGYGECCAQYRKWYYELIVEEIQPYVTPEATHFRVGWASTEGFGAYPGAGDGFGSNAVGDCLYSYGFDGLHLWTGGRPRPVGCYRKQMLQTKDVISCCLDLSAPSMSFRINGQPVQGMFEDFNLDGMFFPVVSMSAGVKVRFLVGGLNGEFKFMPPAGYAPAHEALLPEKELVIEPVRGSLGLNDGRIVGPATTLDQSLFKPNPVDTSKAHLFEYLENTIEKLAENIHELWAMTRIQAGWNFGLVRDDTRRQNPCLTSFDRLPEQQRNFNITLVTETLKTIVALGYLIGIADDDAEYKLKKYKLPRQYLMNNGYKPGPLDLTHVKLNDQLEGLVEKLASNSHNVWAVERIRQGWTYGYSLDVKNKRNPRLVPFMLCDEAAKQSQRNSIRELIRTLLGYGFAIEPPDDRIQKQLESAGNMRNRINGIGGQEVSEKYRMFRVESTYSVKKGKWYYEFQVETGGEMRVGWALPSVEAGISLGSDEKAWVLDGYTSQKWHVTNDHYGRQWQAGDIVSCLLDFDEQTISFTLNGELLIDNLGMEAAFTFNLSEVQEHGLVPVVAMYQGQEGRLNLGSEVSTGWFMRLFLGIIVIFCFLILSSFWLRTLHNLLFILEYFTIYGMQEGYQPFCSKIKQAVPIWYTKSKPTFDNIVQNEEILVKKTPGSATSPPTIAINYKAFGTLRTDPKMIHFRLNMPIRSREFYQKSDVINIFPEIQDEGVIDFEQDFDYLGHQVAKGEGHMGRLEEENEYDKFLAYHKNTTLTNFKPGQSRGQRLDQDVKADEPSVLYDRDIHRLKTTSQYMFSVRILPGQDLSQIWVGWVTSGFHFYNSETFDMGMARTVTLTLGDTKGRITETIKRQDCFMLCGSDIVKQLQNGQGEVMGRAGGDMSESGTVITCTMNIATGLLQFKVNEKIMPLVFQVEPNTMLYPAAFALPTTDKMMQFELDRTKHHMPISAGMFKSEAKNYVPQLPPRLNVQTLKRISWTRLPNKILNAEISKPSPRMGWIVKVQEPVRFMAVHIPEENRCVDILELIEMPELLRFHSRTMRLYSNMCALGNYRVAHALCSYIDQQQFMYCINSQYLAGPLRVTYHDLLIDIHLAPHADARSKTQNEFVLPLNDELKKKTLYEDPSIKEPGLPGVCKYISLRSPFTSSCTNFVTNVNAAEATNMLNKVPEFPLEQLRAHVIKQLTDAVTTCRTNCHTLAGGTVEHLFVPLLKMCDTLLVMGAMDSQHLVMLLTIISSRITAGKVDLTLHPEITELRSKVGDGLLTMKLNERIKLELCKLLHHLCDCNLRHRIEAMQSFSNVFCSQMQVNQRARYDQVMEALNLSAAMTAKMTKEFRSPPADQTSTIIRFKNFSDEAESPAPVEIRYQLWNWHIDLLRHCGEIVEDDVESMEESFNLSDKVQKLYKTFENSINRRQGQFDSILKRLKGNNKPINQSTDYEIYEQYSKTQLAEEERGENRGLRPNDSGLGLSNHGSETNLAGSTTQTAANNPYLLEISQDDQSKYDKSETFEKLVAETMIRWAEEDTINDPRLVREIFHLLHRQYSCLQEVSEAIEKTYCIAESSKDDTIELLTALGRIRSLLFVQMGEQEEKMIGKGITTMTNNRVFYQHPNLMRALEMHTTVMSIMVGVLSNDTGVSESGDTGEFPEIVKACCKFLCYFCRISHTNQRAMFEHFSFLLEHSSVGLDSPSARGCTPLDVAAASILDNNELSLQITESHIDQIVAYLSECGLRGCQRLKNMGFPEYDWDPLQGERYLDFLKDAVFVNGESVEENANLVVRSLIRRPECLGPSLRGEGGQGLLAAIEEALQICQDPSRDTNNPEIRRFKRHLPGADAANDFSGMNSDSDKSGNEEIHFGYCILSFYSSLIDLLGRCAPEQPLIMQGKAEALRIRSILRSLVPLENLVGIISLPFELPRVEKVTETVIEPIMSACFTPDHKSAMLLFLERVYGIEDVEFFLHLIEQGFLGDIRAAAQLDTSQLCTTDMALALNRYLCSSVLPSITKHTALLDGIETTKETLLDSLLHSIYRLSKGRAMTKAQKDVISDCLVGLASVLQPSLMHNLLRKLTFDVPTLSEQTMIPIRLLTLHYERCWQYYCLSSGCVEFGCASDEERHLTMMLFWGIFDALSKKDESLFSKALPCLCAIACALPPDYAVFGMESRRKDAILDAEGNFDPKPVDTSDTPYDTKLNTFVEKYSEQLHELWSYERLDNGWIYKAAFSDIEKTHPLLKPYNIFTEKEKDVYRIGVREAIRALQAWGWIVEKTKDGSASDEIMPASGDRSRSFSRRGGEDFDNNFDSDAPGGMNGYQPKPHNLESIALNRELNTVGEQLAENFHMIWAKRKKVELEEKGGTHPLFVPYDTLTAKEKERYRNKAYELLRFMQFAGYRLVKKERDNIDHKSSQEKRFSYILLQRLLNYLDEARNYIEDLMVAIQASRQVKKLKEADGSEDFDTPIPINSDSIKFFSKVVLPLIQSYFQAHQHYYVMPPSMPPGLNSACNKEKEMVAMVMCSVAALLRQKVTFFGKDSNITVECLHCLGKCFDASAVMKMGQDAVRQSLIVFFNDAATDMEDMLDSIRNTNGQLNTISSAIRTARHWNYVTQALIPTLRTIFKHVGDHGFGREVLVEEMQVACYKILNALYPLGSWRNHFVRNLRSKDDNTLKVNGVTEKISPAVIEMVDEVLNKNRAAFGETLAGVASAFPVAFLEPKLNKYNPVSVYNALSIKDRQILGLPTRLEQLAPNLPTLAMLLKDIEDLAISGARYDDAPELIDVVLPAICRYLPQWIDSGPECIADSTLHCTEVNGEMMNSILGNVLRLIYNNLGTEEAEWMKRIAVYTQPIMVKAGSEILGSHFLPILEKTFKKIERTSAIEEDVKNDQRLGAVADVSDLEMMMLEDFGFISRDIYAFYPLLIRFIDKNKTTWITQRTPDAEDLFWRCADIFLHWAASINFRREEQNYVVQNDIDNMAVITADHGGHQVRQHRRKLKKRGDLYSKSTSLIVVCAKRMLPVGLNACVAGEHKLAQFVKHSILECKKSDTQINDYVGEELEAMSGDEHYEYDEMELERRKDIVIKLGKVLANLYMVDHVQAGGRAVWEKLLSRQRKRAIVSCFRMTPLYNTPRHKVINTWTACYRDLWLKTEEIDYASLLIGQLANEKFSGGQDSSNTNSSSTSKEISKTNNENQDNNRNLEREGRSYSSENNNSSTNSNQISYGNCDPLHQLISLFSAAAVTSTRGLEEDRLYLVYSDLMSKSCSVEDELDDEPHDDEGDGDDGDEDLTFAEKERRKQRLLYEQTRLESRGAAEMVLYGVIISASNGVLSDMVMAALKLGIALLNGGNEKVQKNMLEHLQEKKDSKFFSSLSALMNKCSVLDLDAYERGLKAESLGTLVQQSGVLAYEKTLYTCRLFRFLQLLCEGHNSDFQDYLRAQIGNSITVNIIVATVDYLLRLQESIADFYWYYSGKSTVDTQGRLNFGNAIKIAKQVFNTLTEYIQGPCHGNQQTLAQSRLWDAVVGFLHVFAHLQEKLAMDVHCPTDLLNQLLDLQQDMVVMLLSMLEGNVVNGTIGRMLLDTFCEAQSDVEMIMRFFTTFLKLQHLIDSERMREVDPDDRGIVTRKEWISVLEQTNVYNLDEQEFLLKCIMFDEFAKFNYRKFCEDYHEPAMQIGFNLAVLLTNLKEHMSTEPRLKKFLEMAEDMFEYFKPYLGRIEIIGQEKKIERIYFEIKESSLEQWEKPQIRDSKREFIFDVVNSEGGETGKMEAFVDFCEDTIFEMQLAAKISQTKFTNEDEEDPEEEDNDEDGEKSIFSNMGLAFKHVFGTISSFFTWRFLKRTYKSIRKLTMKDIIVTLVWLCILFPLQIGKQAFYLTIVNAFMLIKFAIDGELVAAIKKTSWTELLCEFPEPCQDGIQGFNDENDLDNSLDKNSNPLLPPMRDPEVEARKREQEAKKAAKESEEPEVLDEEQLLAKQQREKLMHDREMIQLCVWKPPMTGFGDMSLEEAAEALGLYEEDTGLGDWTSVTSRRPSQCDEAELIQMREANEAKAVHKLAAILGLKHKKDHNKINLSAEDLPQWRWYKHKRERPSKYQADRPPDPSTLTDICNKLNHFINCLFCLFARYFYSIKLIALFVVVLINIILLSFHADADAARANALEDNQKGYTMNSMAMEFVRQEQEGGGVCYGDACENNQSSITSTDESDNFSFQAVTYRKDVWPFDTPRALWWLSTIHTTLCLVMLIGFYNLKVPLIIFKREKDISRKMEFDGLYVEDSPSEEDIAGQWDKFVISSPSFPKEYWDKFVKKKVFEKYSDMNNQDRLSKILGVDNPDQHTQYQMNVGQDAENEHDKNGHGDHKPNKDSQFSKLIKLIKSFDYQYFLWKVGVVLMDTNFLILLMYLIVSTLGHFNHFFFSMNLLDFALNFKSLKTILNSVTHNGKQLILTVALLTVVVYLHSVIAFNFFREFYNTGDDDEADYKCNDMAGCFMFHLYRGVRAGGGIADEIGDPAGHELEYFRVLFDIMFFFFVVIILMAIIQGLVIDSFGELRDQIEQVKEDMDTKCFICSIANDYFDQIPHGFEEHTTNEHNLANYLFFIQHIINKDETEYTGQETYVWKLYQARIWDFFPVGDCFRKQYENEI